MTLLGRYRNLTKHLADFKNGKTTDDFKENMRKEHAMRAAINTPI
jgi:hypothetical protein